MVLNVVGVGARTPGAAFAKIIGERGLSAADHSTGRLKCGRRCPGKRGRCQERSGPIGRNYETDLRPTSTAVDWRWCTAKPCGGRRVGLPDRARSPRASSEDEVRSQCPRFARSAPASQRVSGAARLRQGYGGSAIALAKAEASDSRCSNANPTAFCFSQPIVPGESRTYVATPIVWRSVTAIAARA
jgi:hypothetical protein